MQSKHHLKFLTLATICSLGLSIGTASAYTPPDAPLMPTKDPVAHHNATMQRYFSPGNLPSGPYRAATMVPLMPTKDHPAHKNSAMQYFPWAKQYRLNRRTPKPSIGTEAPLMPTKDPVAHYNEDMQEDYLD